jgi:RhtB (resistance to homoserine/threonine) family protein
LPVELSTLIAFATAVVAIVLSPGPDTMLILRYALTSGHKAGFAAVAGVQLGLILHTLLAVVGLSVIIASSPILFRGIAIAGAAYLAWLGIQSFREKDQVTLDGDRRPVSALKACRDAILTNVLNPKVILLFLALLPNFVVVGRDDVAAQLITLSAALIVINVAWQAPLAWAAQRIRRWLLRPKVQRFISRISGCVLMGFAILMLYQHLV